MLTYACIYVSFATTVWNENDLRHLLAQCRSNNSNAGVTGMLLYGDKKFMQLLEGEEETVRALVERISRDERHEELTVLWSDYNDHRHFDDWTMGFRRFSETESTWVDGFSPAMDSPATALDVTRTATTGHELLMMFTRLG